MERICVIKDIYKALYRFERDFADEHGITINEAMVLCALREGETRTAGALSEYVGLSNSRVSICERDEFETKVKQIGMR